MEHVRLYKCLEIVSGAAGVLLLMLSLETLRP